MVSDRARRRIERLLEQRDEAADQEDWVSLGEYAKYVLALEPDNADTQDFLAAAVRRPSESRRSVSPRSQSPDNARL